MRKEKHSIKSNEKEPPAMKVIETGYDRTHLEFEIHRHVKSIRALIHRLRPLERQRYYDGLLAHLLSQPLEYPFLKPEGQKTYYDYSNLTSNELSLVKELSIKIEELYRQSERESNN